MCVCVCVCQKNDKTSQKEKNIYFEKTFSAVGGVLEYIFCFIWGIYNDSFEDEKEISEELQVYKYDLSK